MKISLEVFAREALGKLLDAGERAQAGMRTRAPALTTSALSPYRTTTSLHGKEVFENVVLAAAANGAISVLWDEGYAPNARRSEGFIARIDLVELKALAKFLDRKLVADKIQFAEKQFASLIDTRPVLSDVISRWTRLKTVRGFWPEDVVDWLDAVRVLEYAAIMKLDGMISIPIREASTKLFKDSKRIEKLAAPVDVLLSGDIDGEARPSEEVWKEIGLFREEHPMRLAGNTTIVRDRVTAVLDRPYIGLPATTVLSLGSTPQYVLTIENQTTFHSEARRLCEIDVLLIFTGGMPTPAWRAAYCRLLSTLPLNVPIHHWGDVDEGGFRIAALLSRDASGIGHKLQPWRMHPKDIPEDMRCRASEATAMKMRAYAVAAGWGDLGDALLEAKITVEQEGLEADT